MVLVFIGGPIWGATGSPQISMGSRAWVLRHLMGVFVLIGVGRKSSASSLGRKEAFGRHL